MDRNQAAWRSALKGVVKKLLWEYKKIIHLVLQKKGYLEKVSRNLLERIWNHWNLMKYHPPPSNLSATSLSLSNKHKVVGIKIHLHVSWVDYDNFYNGFLPGGKSTQIQTGYVYLLLWLSEYLACKPVVVSVGWTYHPHTDLFHRHVSHLHKPQLSLFPFSTSRLSVTLWGLVSFNFFVLCCMLSGRKRP